LMLQVSLLLLGCALSRYLWEINTTVASVVVGVTSFGVLFYIFIVVAGAVTVSCPYQTPGAQIIRRIFGIICRLPDVPRWFLHITGILQSVFSASIKDSVCCERLPKAWRAFKESPSSFRGITVPLLIIPFLLLWLIIDACKLGRAIVWGLINFVRGAYFRLRRGLERRTDVLDMHCVLWTLRTSLDGPVRLLVLDYLATKTTLADFDPTLIIDCFDILLGCVKITDDRHVTIIQGLEQLARRSALCFLQTLSHLAAINPTSRVFEGIRQRYITAFPFWTNLDGLPFSHTLATIHRIFYQTRIEQMRRTFRSSFFEKVMWWQVQWEDYELFDNEHITLAHALTKLARFEYQRSQPKKVPRWLLRFALHFLSQDPLPPTSVIADCLSIIAIDLDCTFQDVTTPDERYVRICQMSASLIKN